jgi:hypothetical protein
VQNNRFDALLDLADEDMLEEKSLERFGRTGRREFSDLEGKLKSGSEMYLVLVLVF